MNKNILTVICLFFLLAPVTLYLLGSSTYSSHDGMQHLLRIAKYFQALTDGQIPPRWADQLYYGLGSPVLIFYGQLPYFLASLLHFFKLSYVQSMQITMAITTILSGYFFFLWIKPSFGRLAAIVGAVAYIWAPYHLVDIYIRAAFPEVVSFMFVPLMFLSVDVQLTNRSIWPILLASGSFAALILSHNLMALLFGSIWFGYVLVMTLTTRNRRILIISLLSALLAVGITTFYWLPAITEQSEINFKAVNISMQNQFNFVTLERIIFSRWGFFPPYQPNPMTVQLGIGQWLVILLTACIFIFLMLRGHRPLRRLGKTNLSKIIYFVAITFFAIFLMTPESTFLWNHLPFLSIFLYPWRFLTAAIFSAAFLAAVVACLIQKTRLALLVLLIILIAPNVFSLRTFGSMTISDNFLRDDNLSGDVWGEFLPKYADVKEINKLASSSDCLHRRCVTARFQGPQEVVYKVLTEKSQFLKLDYLSPTSFSGQINLFYYPGWVVYLDNKPINIKVSSWGTMIGSFPAGQHQIVSRFTETPPRRVSDIISLAFFTLWSFLGLRILAKAIFGTKISPLSFSYLKP